MGYLPPLAQQIANADASVRPPTKGDIAILSFLAAAEILEAGERV